MVGLAGLLGPKVLYEHRNALERPRREVVGGCQLQCLFELAVDDRVQVSVEALYAVDRGLHGFNRR